MQAILVFFHVPANTGYAISSYERAFLAMAQRLTPGRVHFAFVHTHQGRPDHLQDVLAFDPATRSPTALKALRDYVRTRGIDFAFGVDQPIDGRPCYRVMRAAGVRAIVSYWGAPMSPLNQGPKLWAKRIEVALRRGPDHFIFESNAMARRATHGRGVRPQNISVVPAGTNPERYRPDRPPFEFARLGIPEGRKVIFFSGHVGERRKGCDVLVRSAMLMAEQRSDFHFLLCGDKGNEASWLLDILGDHRGRQHVTFGGYRTDLPDIMPSCYLGAIASTGWDSYPASSLEMQACGVPMVVSDLDGTPETVEEGVTGLTFPSGDHVALAQRISSLLDDRPRRDAMGRSARARIVSGFTLAHQTDRLVDTCERVAARV